MENKNIDYKPFDVVIYIPTNERGLIKRVSEDGKYAFVLFGIQSTAQRCNIEDIKFE